MNTPARPALLVLDTNVVLDWLVFDDPSARPLAQAVETEAVRVVTSADCLDELRRVLAYPAFGLDPSAQASALARYGSHATPFDALGRESSGLPLCADPDDQKFLELAWHARAAYLVTKDKALLVMARRIGGLGRFRIVAPADVPCEQSA